jgi:hypothetical protein
MSVTGVLVAMTAPAPEGQHVKVLMPWNVQALELSGVIVRCVAQYTAGARTEWCEPEHYRIAISFSGVDTHTATNLERLMRQAAGLPRAEVTSRTPTRGVES